MLVTPIVYALKSEAPKGYVHLRDFALSFESLGALDNLLEGLSLAIHKSCKRLEFHYLDGFGLPLFTKNRLLVGEIIENSEGRDERRLQYFKKNQFVREYPFDSNDWPYYFWQIPDPHIRDNIKKPLGYWSLHCKSKQRVTLEQLLFCCDETPLKPLAQLGLATVSSESNGTYVVGTLVLRAVHGDDDVECMRTQKAHQDKIISTLQSFLVEHSLTLKHPNLDLLKVQLGEIVVGERIERDMTVEQALQWMLGEAIKGIHLYYPGVLEDIDTEFLHQFRVNVRKTRSLVKECKKVLEKYDLPWQEFKVFFKKMNDITSAVRDLDVYLLEARQWIEDRDEIFAEQIEPFICLLREKREKAFNEMIAWLDSSDYRAMIQRWEEVVDNLPQYRLEAHKTEQSGKKHQTIGEFAEKKISKLFHKLLAEGSVLDEQTPDTEYHQLRLVFKRFRYLLDFFKDLFESGKEREVFSSLIRNSKKLQTLLGDFQDITVQKGKLMRYAQELAEKSDESVSYTTFLAMGELMGDLNSDHDSLKHRFTLEFETFQQNKGLHDWLD